MQHTTPDAWPADATARLVRAICAATTKDALLAALAGHLAAAREMGRAEGLARARRLPMPRPATSPIRGADLVGRFPAYREAVSRNRWAETPGENGSAGPALTPWSVAPLPGLEPSR